MKYIVYKTTNLVNNYIYIGVHKTKDPYIFDGYIGCSVVVNRPSTYQKARTCFQKAVQEYGVKNFKREVIAIFDNADEAYDLEKQIVNENFIAREDVYNMVLGGVNSDVNGIKVFRYLSDGTFDCEFKSFEEAAKSSDCDAQQIRRATIYKNKCKGYYFSTDKLNKIDLSLYEKSNSKQIVYRYLVSGQFDTEFESQSKAARMNDLCLASLQRAIQFGYCVHEKYYFSTIKDDFYDRARQIYIWNREVSKYDRDGSYIKTYTTQLEAEKDNPNCNISKAIRLKKSDKNGCFWALIKVKNYNKRASKARKVGLFDNNGNLIKEWLSVKACSKEVGMGVENLFRGNQKRYKGKIYKYIE